MPNPASFNGVFQRSANMLLPNQLIESAWSIATRYNDVTAIAAVR
jgi:hypothetical protein